MNCEKCGTFGAQGYVVNMKDAAFVEERLLCGGRAAVLCTACANLWAEYVRATNECEEWRVRREAIEHSKCLLSGHGSCDFVSWRRMHDEFREAESALFDLSGKWLAEKIEGDV